MRLKPLSLTGSAALVCISSSYLNFTENDYQLAFQTIAKKLINNHELVINEQEIFRLCEIEFYFYHQIRHSDTFAHRHPE